MKRLISAILTLALLFSISLPLCASAASEGWYEVQSTSPNGYCYLYSNASDRDGVSRNKGRYNNGALVYVISYYGGQDGKYNYCYVQTQDGKTGYMHDYALIRYTNNYNWYVVKSSQPKGYCYLYSAASDRDGLSQNMGRYDNGELVRLIDYYGGQDGKYNYCLVETLDGKTGYMHDYAITPFKPGSLPSATATPKPTTRPTAKPTAKPTARPTTRPVGKLAQLPELTYQSYGNVKGGNTNVYTGPSTSYYRTTSGKAYVANGGSLRVYGKENGYYLIQYSAILNGTTIPRWSFIPASRFSLLKAVDSLDYDWLPITIKANAHISDAPDWSHSYNTSDIDIDQDSAFALAKYIDSDGTYWVYFEAIGYADTVSNQGYVSVRGFVPMSQVSLR